MFMLSHFSASFMQVCCQNISALSGLWPSFVCKKVYSTLLPLDTKKIQLLYLAWMAGMKVFVVAGNSFLLV